MSALNKPTPRRKGGNLRYAAFTLVVVACGALMSGCFLTNIRVDECGADSECSSAFGIGSACVDGYCSDPPAA